MRGSEQMYRRADRECWKCSQVTAVYTWTGHEAWGQDEPPLDGRPPTVQFIHSSVVPDGYWGNVCEHCGAIQGDWYLFMEPDGPFFAWDE